MTVGLVIVSHSERIADGVVELAGQMAPDVLIVAAGGVDDGEGPARIGTSFERVQAAIERAGTGDGNDTGGDGVVVLTDLGSAVMTAETVLEFLEPAERDRVRLARAALVEGAVAAAVQAQGGSSLEEVVRAAEGAVIAIRNEPASGSADDPVAAPEVPGPGSRDPEAGGAASAETDTTAGPTASGSWTLRNRMGLHARPAAALATGLADLDAEVLVNGVDGKSVMLLMSLGLGQGKTLTVTATGPDARTAVDLVGQAVEGGFGESE
jgi:PTS hybrid protein